MRSPFKSLLHILGLGLLGAGIVHIAVLLLIPVVASQTLWERLNTLGDTAQFHLLNDQAWSAQSDPLMRSAACVFNLDDGPVHISALGKIPFWSLGLYNRQGDVIFSVNDQVTNSNEPDVLIMTPLQKLLLEQELPESLSNSLLVSQDIDEGIIVLRAFEPDQSWKNEIAEFFKSAECMPLDELFSTGFN